MLRFGYLAVVICVNVGVLMLVVGLMFSADVGLLWIT